MAVRPYSEDKHFTNSAGTAVACYIYHTYERAQNENAGQRPSLIRDRIVVAVSNCAESDDGIIQEDEVRVLTITNAVEVFHLQI